MYEGSGCTEWLVFSIDMYVSLLNAADDVDLFANDDPEWSGLYEDPEIL